MTSEQVSAASVAGPQEGPRSKPETSPKQVFEAFQKGFQYYEKGISVLQKKAEKDPASLSKVEKRRLSDFEVCKQGGQKAGEDGKLISIETPAGTSHEGIPVEGMVKNLREQIQERRKVNISQLHGTALDKISEEISEMERILSVIESNSKPFRHARIEEGLTDPAFFDERTKAEASIISEDGLRKSENPSDSDRVKEDWYDAEQSLNRRRELILPKEKAVSEQEQIEEVLDQLSSLVDRKGQIGSALQPEPSTLTPEVAAPVSEGPATATPEPVTPKSTPLPESSSPAETTSPTVELSPRDHKPEFFIDNLYDQEHVAKIDDIRGGGKLSVEKKALENLVFTEKDGKQTVSDLLTQVAGPMRAGETEPTYRSRLVSEVARRLRFQGDNRGSNDPLFRELKTRGLLDEEGKSGRLLQAAEGMINLYLEDDNALMMEDYRRFREDGRFYLTAADEEAAGERRLSGSMSLFSEKGERKLMPDRDLFASAMVSEYMMDIPYETTPDGKTTTFREKVTELDGKRKAAKDQGNRGEFDVLTDEVTGLRQEFYSKLENVLVKRSRGKGVTESSYNPFDPKRNLFENQVYQQLGLLLNKQTTPDLLSALVDHYVEHNNYAKGKEALLAKLKNLYDLKEGELVVPNFLIYAQEGTDFMERKMIRKPELHKIEKYIRPKKFIKEGPYVDVRVPYEESAPSTVTPPEKKGDGETGKTPEAAPAGKEEGEGEKEPKGEGKNPEGAPAAEDEKLEELASNLDAGAGFINKERKVQNMLQVADHLFADDLRTETKSFWYRARDKALGWSYRIPLLGGVIRGMAHPVQMIWQQGLARSVFEQQHIRFAADLNATLQATGGKGIPVEMTIEMAQKAIDEGIALKKQEKNILKKFSWMVTDTLKGITGISQTSEQQLAKKWLGDELAKPEDQRVAELRMTGSQTISEQTDLGERYAQWNKTLTFEQSNKVKVSSEAGETRHQLPAEMQKPVSDRLKGFIVEFAEGKLTEKQLIEKVNEYLMGEVRADLIKTDPNLAKELDTQEVGSNILNLARYVTGKDKQGNVVEENRWQRYKTEKGKEQSKWEELEVNLLVGKAEFGRVRGHKEMGFLADNLARRLSERGGVSEKLQAGAAAYAKDITTNVASYAAGYWGAALGMSILNIPKNTALKVLGGFAGIAGGAAFKETGFAIMPLAKKLEFTKWGHKFTPFMIKGRYLKEVEQLSREAAKGRLTPERAKIRKEMGTLLVPRLKVQELLEGVGSNAGLESLVYKKDDLTVDEAKRLFSQLVDIKARMRLTDQSQTGAMDFKTQNYFEFVEGHENQQNERLTAALEQGIVKLIKSGQEGLLGANNSFDRFDNMTAVAEAQLRYSSADKKAMGKWLQKEKGLTKQEADNWISTMQPDIDLQIQKTDSIKAKNRRLTRLTLIRGASTFLKASITGMATEGIMDFVQDVQHGGFQEAFGELKEIYVDGKPPLELNDQGQLVADLTTGQKFYLGARYWVEPPFPSTGHFTQIDNVNLNLPGALSYQEQVINGHTYQALIDIRTGDVKMDLTGFKLDYKDVNGDSHLELVAIDDATGQIRGGLTGGETYVTDLFHQAGIDLKPDGIRESIPQQVEAFNPAAIVPKGADINGDGTVDVTTKIPDNTSWQYDPASGKMDLHGTNIDGTDRVLIEDATISPDGQITGGDYDHNLITINNTPGGAGPEINVEPVSGSEIWGAAAHYRVVHAHAESTEAIRNQTFSTNDSTGEHPIGVRYTFPGHTIRNPNTGVIETLDQAAADNRVGLYLQIPHFGPLGEDVGIFVPAHFDASLNKFVVDFDPTDTTTMIKLPDGTEVSMADFSQNFLNEAKLAEYVRQNGGPGILDSETWYEGREFFNLANPDGDITHQGRILGGYFDTDSKATEFGFTPAPGQDNHGAFIAIHADHGSGAVDLTIPEGPPQPSPSIPEINVGPISDTNTIDQLGYRVESPPFAFTYEPNPMIPMRENIEKGEGGKAVISDRAGQPQTGSATQTPATVVPPTAAKTAPSPVVEEPAFVEVPAGEEKKESRLATPAKKIELTDEEKQRLEKMTEQAKKVLNTEKSPGKKYSEEVYKQLLEAIKLTSKDKFTDEQIREYLDQSLEASLSNDEEVVAHVKGNRAVGYDDNLETAVEYLKSICLKLGINNTQDLKDYYLIRLVGKVEEQLSKKDPAKRNSALHRMASLAAVMDLADRGELDFSTPVVVEQDKNPTPDTQPSAIKTDKKPADDEEEKK